ncbi:response regulator [Pelagibacterium montanilacus]|uniref:response regulator n=1 Tax=Pelagibacterium montanilacus TaxID=2185280 RepID=UPI0013E0C009|nr:response regulator [Pelagibacterium montanilacus]
MTQAEAADISSKCVLVVEDDYLLARELCNDLKKHGASVLGPAPTVHYAKLLLGKRKIDGAILDISLFGEDVYSLVDQLQGDGIPIVFATAYQRDQIARDYRSIDTLHKPICLEGLRRKVADFAPMAVAEPGRAPVSPGFEAPRPPAEGVRDIHERWSRVLARAMRQPH